MIDVFKATKIACREIKVVTNIRESRSKVTLTAKVRFKLRVIKMENEGIKTLQNNSFG